jgi:hypothetical protein
MPSVFVKTEKWLAVSGEIRRQERAPICASLRKCTGQDSGIKALIGGSAIKKLDRHTHKQW